MKAKSIFEMGVSKNLLVRAFGQEYIQDLEDKGLLGQPLRQRNGLSYLVSALPEGMFGRALTKLYPPTSQA